MDKKKKETSHILEKKEKKLSNWAFWNWQDCLYLL